MKLRSYKNYLKKIKAYANLCNVKIVFQKDVEGSGHYQPNCRKVVIDKDLSESEIISTLLHELGHFMDDLIHPQNNFSNRFHRDGRTAIEEERSLTRLQKQMIMKSEKQAWKNARGLASQLCIPLGNWFYSDEKSSLSSYNPIRIR